uniref:NADH dehydrogenase subunit 2 n=1 Tax=Ixodes rubicundus TaxID=722771 RepID=UPI002238CD48|nr:NADH dehydrogenase subunit 2 [Ixodes rubicundus]UYB78119.1 NADH dehydrogenase subunit 2 [Ixodes rubicundus]
MLQKMIFYWVLLISILLAFSSSLWFSLWISLEINMMIFIPLMNSKNFLSSNSMLYYYIVQSLASSLFFFSSLMYSIYYYILFYYIIMISIMIKLAAAPFHIWFPQISEGLSFFSFFILSTIQKMIPLFIISSINNYFLILFIIFSSIMGSLGGLNQMSLKKILAFSSISHLSWILSLIMINQNYWFLYFIMYMLILMKIIYFFQKNNLNMIMSLNFMKTNFFKKMNLFSLFLSLGGMPPFLGFFMKWVSILFILNKMSLILMILIMSSLINLFFYIRILFPLMLNFNILMKFPLIVISYSSMIFFMMNCIFIIMMIPLITVI